MLVVDRSTKTFRDSSFTEFPDLLRPDDVLVLNNTRVFPARLIGRREPGGGKAEIFLVRRYSVQEMSEIAELNQTGSNNEIWEVLVKPGRNLRRGAIVSFAEGLTGEVLSHLPSGHRIARFHCEGNFDDIVDCIGLTPLPPYIKREAASAISSHNAADNERYQTVYATERGAIAAPTAGLHFTPQVLATLRQKGTEIVEITHHVGYGTFQPVRVDEITEHHIDAETYTISEKAAKTLTQAKKSGRRIVAVGTTTTRALESAIVESGQFNSGRHSTELYIYPGYEFKAIDCLLTNFHLPQSSLLMLVSALTGHQFVMSAYRHAVDSGYRFYSYGDCMFIA